jgi:hypothetical protein
MILGGRKRVWFISHKNTPFDRRLVLGRFVRAGFVETRQHYGAGTVGP